MEPGPGSRRQAVSPVVVVITADAALRARVLSRLGSTERVLVADTPAQAAECLLDLAARESSPLRLLPDGVTAVVGRTPLPLTRLEHDLLDCLLSAPERVWTFGELSETVWGVPFVGDGCQVRAVVKRLRRKLAGAGADVVVQTVRGRGLRAVRVSVLELDCPETAPDQTLSTVLTAP